MWLSTAHLQPTDEDTHAARYVAHIEGTGTKTILTDVMGVTTEVEGSILSVDLTGATVVIATDAA